MEEKKAKKINSLSVEVLDAKIEEYSKQHSGSKYLKHLFIKSYLGRRQTILLKQK